MLIINKELCIGCGICADQCPFAAIEIQDGVAVVGDACTLCGSCVESCDVGALSMEVAEKTVKADLASWSGVWVFCEYRLGELAPVSLELLGAGRRLADLRGVALGAVLFGHDTGDTAKNLIAHGADRIYRIDHEQLATYAEDTYASLLTSLINEYRPEIVLAGATAIGRSFIPGVATCVNAGLTADCTALDIRGEDGALMQTRPAFGGNIMATIVCPSSRPQMATVRPKVMRALEYDGTRSGEICLLYTSPSPRD